MSRSLLSQYQICNASSKPGFNALRNALSEKSLFISRNFGDGLLRQFSLKFLTKIIYNISLFRNCIISLKTTSCFSSTSIGSFLTGPISLNVK